MASNPPGSCCNLGTLHEGTPSGQDIKIAGTIDGYLAKAPEAKAHKNTAILYLPDVFGIWQNSKLMADAFAEKGYTTLVVDLFDGDTVPFNKEGFDFQAWRVNHTTDHVDPIVLKAIQHLKDSGVTKIAAVGYCFGAKYVVRHYKSGINVGYLAHPSFVEEAELAAITGPLAIAAAETDSIFTTELRHKSEEILIATKQPYQINLYSSVVHGFAVRGNMENKIEKYAKEQAFLQAVTFFDNFPF